MMAWTAEPAELRALQLQIARLAPSPWDGAPGRELVAGCFVCFGRGGSGPGATGDRGWAGAVVMSGPRVAGSSAVCGEAGAPYAPGLLAGREGPLLEQAVRQLPRRPEVLLVNATGRDHPRRAGLALQLGWALDLPTVGITHRPLSASGPLPGGEAGEASPLWIEQEQVGWWLRTRTGAHPVAVSPGWRTNLDSARAVVEAAVRRSRTPEPIRQARRLARTARAAAARQAPAETSRSANGRCTSPHST